jgi:hypothetical protein
MGRAKNPGAAGTESLQHKTNASASSKCVSPGFSHFHFRRNRSWSNEEVGGEPEGFVFNTCRKAVDEFPGLAYKYQRFDRLE